MADAAPVRLDLKDQVATLTLARPEHRNSFDEPTIKRYVQALDELDSREECRIIVLEGQKDVFCSGMDLEAFTANDGAMDLTSTDSPYMQMLKRFTSNDKVVISKVEGKVIAGGVGIVAASDLVYAGPNASFSLSEALWGLLPAQVMPYLVRRVGFQQAYRMTLTTETVNATRAKEMNLVDELSDTIDLRIQAILKRLKRLDPQTIADLKAYFKKMWIVNESMEQMAVDEINRLSQLPRVKKNIENYIRLGRLPWETW